MDIHETLRALAREGMPVRTIAARIQCSTSHVRTLLAGGGEYIPVRSVALIQQLRDELEQRLAAEVAAAISRATPDESPVETLATDPTSCAGALEIEPPTPAAPPAPPGSWSAAPPAPTDSWWSRLFRRPVRTHERDLRQQGR